MFFGNKAELHYHNHGSSFWDFLKIFFRVQKRLDKQNPRILFIDDHKFPIVDNLKKADYQVEWIKDIKKIEDPRVLYAHIIFVDYKGVGKNLSDKEGIGVCKQLKERYGDKKYVVLFSGENIPNTLIQEIKSASDEVLRKGEDKSKYFDVINIASKKIKL